MVMKTTNSATRIMRASLLAALALGPGLAASAQTSPPAPRSVAPNYTPPKNDPKYYYQDEIQSRARTWDFYLTPGYMLFHDSKAVNQTLYDRREGGTYRTGNLKFDFDDSFSFGLGFDYNITEKLSVGAETFFARPDYEASFHETTGPDAGKTYRIAGEADIYTWNAFVQYNFLKQKLTPFVRGNAGFMYIDTGIPTAPTEWSRWGDYWWDEYYTASRTPTKNDTYFMAGATAGLRYDFNRHVYGAASYTANWTENHRKWNLNQRISITVGWNY
jgi:hypothetical protein